MDVTTSYYNRCRLCIAEARLSLQLFETEAIRLDLVDKIRSYLSINVSMHDGLPQQICYECLSRLELFHSYKQSCLETQHTLKHWNLFCDGGSVPQNVDIFSGRCTSPDILGVSQYKNSASIFANRKSAESMVQHFKSNEVTPTRKPTYLSSPIINKSSTATPPKRKIMTPGLSEEIREISLENTNNGLPERLSLDDSSSRRKVNNPVQILKPGSCLKVTMKELNHASDIDSGTKPSKQMLPAKSLQSSIVDVETKQKQSSSPSPHRGRRSRTPVREIKSSSPQEVSQLLKQSSQIKSETEARKQAPGRFQDIAKSSIEKTIKPCQSRSPSPFPLTRTQSPLKDIKSSPSVKTMPLVQKQIISPKSMDSETGMNSRSQSLDRSKIARSRSPSPFSLTRAQPPSVKTMPLMQKQIISPKSVVSETGMNSRSRSLDRSKSSEKISTKSSPMLPTIQIISIESLAAIPEKSRTKLLENDLLKAKSGNSSTAYTSDKQNGSDTQIVDTVEKPFAPTISEMVKQRKRSNSVSSQNCVSVKKPRKPRTRSSSAVDIGSAGINKENSDANLSDWMLDKEDNSLVPSRNNLKDVDESDTRSVQSIDDSTQALLRLLESDDDDDYYLYQSDAESFVSDSSRPGTPNPRTPMNPYVKVEKLAGESKSKLRVRTEEELSAGAPVRRVRRPRQQSNQYRLVKVVKDEVTGRERYKCLKCGSLLSNKCYIKEHMKIHTGDKDFKCEKCGKAFRNNYMLKAHDAVHMKERNYTCSTCGSKFVQRDRLRQHFRMHTAEQLECTICGHKTNLKSALRRHMRIHTGERPYECEFCGGKYTDRSTWVNHRRIHTGERPYRCVTCNRTFNRKMCLRAHWRTHSDYRPFCCQLCRRRFKSKEVLVKHLSCIHKSIMRSVVNFIKNEGTKE